LQDNITSHWDPPTISEVVAPYVLDNHITTILTFDQQGISGHPNHASLPAGVKHLITSSLTFPPRLFTLISVPNPLKYASILTPAQAKFDLYAISALHVAEILVERVLGRARKEFVPQEGMPVFVAGTKEYLTALRAMRQHKSQLVWFRWLNVMFSRYMWVNEWTEVRMKRG